MNEPNLTLPAITPALRALGLVVAGLALGGLLVGLFAFSGSAEDGDTPPPAACLRAIDLGADLRVAMGETDDLIQRARAAQARGDEALASRLANEALARAKESAEIAADRAAAERGCRGEESPSSGSPASPDTRSA